MENTNVSSSVVLVVIESIADNAKICSEKKTAELAEFTTQRRLSEMMKFPVYALILTK